MWTLEDSITEYYRKKRIEAEVRLEEAEVQLEEARAKIKELKAMIEEEEIKRKQAGAIVSDGREMKT